jgi:hypothetical protein
MHRWPPRRILVAVDFGVASGHACRAAGVLARATGARVTALHAERFEAPPYFTHEQLGRLKAELRGARHRAEAHVRSFASEHGLAPGWSDRAVRTGACRSVTRRH